MSRSERVAKGPRPLLPVNTCNKEDLQKFNESVVKRFALNHEASIHQWLFRAPKPAGGGPGSKAFKYEKDDPESQRQAMMDCSKWAIEQCQKLECAIPSKLVK